MRIRSTKPEFWRSRRVASVSWHARLVLKGLESYVDDNGVGKDDIALIVSDIFSRDHFKNPRETVARVSEAISHLSQVGLVWRYEADGLALLYISNWESVQRVDKPQNGRYPRPDGTTAYRESIIRESVASFPEVLAPGTGEQGNRGTGESTYASSYVARAASEPISLPPLGSADDAERVTDDRHAAVARRQAEQAARADLTRREISDCRLCDERGYRGGRVCDHDPAADERNAAGLDKVRAALAGGAA